ncbi:MAG: molybdenum cofactor biosynthesis protein MoaE [Marinicella sp.]|nr:molybdenum cofactor biosynthesis protein MoaE [Xanthomonadales bacterium]
MFSLTNQVIDPKQLTEAIRDSQSGAFASFEGWVRNHNHGKSVIALHYEAHNKLAVEVGQQIMTQAIEKFAINHARCCHRIGQLAVGEVAIWVGVSANHRKAALAACEYILNQVKAEVPIWKNEFYADGESGWVEANHCC